MIESAAHGMTLFGKVLKGLGFESLAHTLGMEMIPFIALVIFAITFFGIIFEMFDKAVIAMAGAIAMILSGVFGNYIPGSHGTEIKSPSEVAIEAIDFETIILLMSMMILVEIATESKIFSWLNVRITKLTRGNPLFIMLLFLLVTAIMSAFLDNVTTVLLIVPITIALVRGLGRDPKLFVLAEIIFSNIGGALTLIGDPPNIIIGNKANLSFNDFIVNLYVPIFFTGITVLAALIYFNWKQIKPIHDNMKSVLVSNVLIKQIEYKFLGVEMNKKFIWTICSILLMTIIGFMIQGPLNIELHVIAFAGAVIALLFSSKNIHVHQALHAIEWTTLFFFAGLFVVVGGVEHAGLLEVAAKAIASISSDPLAITLIILWSAGLLSMVLDNIPFVTVMIPVIFTIQTGMPSDFDINLLWWSLSLGACLGGMGTLVGASANVVAAGIASKNGVNISFARYLKFGFPIAIFSLVICSIYFVIKIGI